MAKSPPEKLSAALRANLRRRKAGAAPAKGKKPAPPAAQAPQKPPKNEA